jgi:hypothetical protein
MKNLLLFCTVVVLISVHATDLYAQDNVGINNPNPDPSAILDMVSDDQGVLVPRLTSNQKINITSPATGLLIYDVDLDEFWYFDGIAWVPVQGSGSVGPTGPQGVPGLPGSTGGTGPQGQIGPTGPTGADGSQGIPGLNGEIGNTGPTGSTGPQGIPGVAGPSGIDGLAGATGPTGATGNDGLIGPTGPTGVVNSAGMYPGMIGMQHFTMDAPLVSSIHSDPSRGYAHVASVSIAVVYSDEITPAKRYLVSSDWSDASLIRAVSVINEHLYALVYSSTLNEYRVYAYDVNDISQGGAQVSFVGKSLLTNIPLMTSNGTDVLFASDAGNSSNVNEIARFTITDPTTFAYVDTYTYGTSAQVKLLGLYNDILFTINMQTGDVDIFNQGNTTPIYSMSGIYAGGNALHGVFTCGDAVYLLNDVSGFYTKIVQLSIFE